MGMVTECPVVKLGKLTDATLDAGTDGSGPEDAVLAKLQVAIASFCQEPPDLFIGGAGEKKDVVEVALAGKFGFSLWQARVLDELAGRE
jgi:hypothetical protein